MAKSKGSIQHPKHPFWVLQCEDENGIVSVTVADTDVRRAARIHVDKLLTLTDVLARMPAAHLAKVKAFAARYESRAAAADQSGGEVAARELISADGEYCTVYSGSKASLIRAGVADEAQFPTRLGGTNSGGYAGYKRNPEQRWKVRSRGRDLFDVYRWHQTRATESGFQRFMRQAMLASQ